MAAAGKGQATERALQAGKAKVAPNESVLRPALRAAGGEQTKAGLLSICVGSEGAGVVAVRNEEAKREATNALKGPTEGVGAILGPDILVPLRDGQADMGGLDPLLVDLNGREELDIYAVVTPLEKGFNSRKVPGGRAGCHLYPPSKLGLGPTDGVGLSSTTLTADSSGPAVSLTISENCDADVQRDMHKAFKKIGSPSALEAIVGRTVTLPTGKSGSVSTGTWQGVYVDWHEDAAMNEGLISVANVTGPNVIAQRRARATAPKQGCVDITDMVKETMPEVETVQAGMLHCFVHHTSASLVVGPRGNGDAIEEAIRENVPFNWHYSLFDHTLEGEDDMTGHVKSSLCGASHVLPIIDGELMVGDEQGLLLAEHRFQGGMFGKHVRNITFTLVSSPS